MEALNLREPPVPSGKLKLTGAVQSFMLWAREVDIAELRVRCCFAPSTMLGFWSYFEIITTIFLYSQWENAL